MLLDYKYIKKQRKLSVSYVNEKGMKSVLDFNVDKFKSYYSTPDGPFANWDGSRCAEKLTDEPSKFDIRTFFNELDPKYKALLYGKTIPRLYTFDIETKLRDDREFTEPSSAEMPIHTISVVSPELKAIVMGDKEMSKEDQKWVQDQIHDFLNNLEFFHTLGLPLPTFQYQYYTDEHDMLEYFLKGIVAKVPVLSGWNCLDYDWQYITSRIRNYHPNLSITCASTIYQVQNKNFKNQRDETYSMPMPIHTPIVDMMEVIDQFDLSGLTAKESTSLDYIASETPGLEAHKIEYDGDLEQLYERDFRRYVFYNAIDSILVQLINYRYKTLNNLYMQARYCGVKVQDSFSKIAISDALIWNDFIDQGYKVVYDPKYDVERGRLLGAYVAKPIPGRWDFITCNDFASLYPSTIITCNLSFENYITHYYDEAALEKYIKAPLSPTGNPYYIIVGPVVYKNANALKKKKELEYGDYVGTFLDEEKLKPFREDPKYFVSVNGHVYHNDRDYAFKRVQRTLKSNRNVSKYLAKQLDAIVMLDVEHILKHSTPSHEAYADNLVKAIKELDYDIHDSSDLLKMSNEQLLEFKRKLADEIIFYTCDEQAMKLMGNSMYGGSSHVAFYWFNLDVARDITGEARNLTKHMESHLPKFWDENWASMTQWHKKWGYEVDTQLVTKLLQDGKHMINIVYGDTDSLYISYTNLLSTIKGFDDMNQRQKLDVIVHINTDFLNDHNKQYIGEYYRSRHADSIHDFELETVALSGLWLNVKKRYCQILLWKDGKYFDEDSLPMKVKGLEMIKGSYPKYVRLGLKRVVRGILEAKNDQHLWEHVNMMVQKEKMGFNQADIDDICASQGINGYTKYIATEPEPKIGVMAIDKKGTVIYYRNHAGAGVKALATYNTLREKYNLKGDPIYGGKCKIYFSKPLSRGGDYIPFAYQAKNYPKWAEELIPVDRGEMFSKYFLDPLNRICKDSMGFEPFRLDGSRDLNLFSDMF